MPGEPFTEPRAYAWRGDDLEERVVLMRRCPSVRDRRRVLGRVRLVAIVTAVGLGVALPAPIATAAASAGPRSVPARDASRETPLTAGSVSEFQPNLPTPNGWGGRAVSVSIDPSNAQNAAAASESGGLFLSDDGGHTWAHDVYLPVSRLSDVRYAETSAGVYDLIVTAPITTDVVSRGGIWQSSDGLTWNHVNAGFSATSTCSPTRYNAFGIGVDQENPYVVHVATDCGLAVSPSGGFTWNPPVQSPTLATPVWSVSSDANSTIDTCGAGGHQRSYDDETFATENPMTSGAGTECWPGDPRTVAFNDDASSVYLTLGDQGLWQGVYDWSVPYDRITWTKISTMPSAGRLPQVTTESPTRAGGEFDLYFTNGYAYQNETCTFASNCAVIPHLPAREINSDHTGTNDLAFGPYPDGHCPVLIATDGGVGTSSGCGHTFTVTGSGAGGYNALQVDTVATTSTPSHDDVYIGTQDNSGWASTDGGNTWIGNDSCGSNPPTQPCADDSVAMVVPRTLASDSGQFVIDDRDSCCDRFSADFTSRGGWPNPPGVPSGPPMLDQAATGTYFQWTTASGGHTLWRTANAGDTWTTIATTSLAFVGASHLGGTEAPEFTYTAVDSEPTLYQPVVRADGHVGLLRIDNLFASSATLTEVDAALNNLGSGSGPAFCDGSGSSVCDVAVGVDPRNGNDLIVADVGAGTMMKSFDGGATWAPDAALTSQVTESGALEFNATDAAGGEQVHTITYDPVDDHLIWVGTEAAGIIASIDGGLDWQLIPGSIAIPAITGFAPLSHTGQTLVSSYGRGLWKVTPPTTVVRHLNLCTTQQCLYGSHPHWIWPAGGLAGGQRLDIALTATGKGSTLAAGSYVWLTAAAAGTVLADGLPIGTDPVPIETDANGQIDVVYLAPQPTGNYGGAPPGIDSLTVANQPDKPTISATISYNDDTVAAYKMKPTPIAPSGSLTPGKTVNINVTPVDQDGNAVPGAYIYLAMTSQVSGSAAVQGTALDGSFQAFFADSNKTSANVTVTYTPGKQGAGTDIIAAQSDPSQAPLIAAKDSYNS